ncbi:hypothetical protein QEZ40_001697 [Streptomyces katrae]|uniref:Uncharacterized protein n=1 Tax=Streptomyces katrae TaxID=68223 RepID=A0ABT7GTV4_9ACTN|nr:hypothetical protein [Streptomyces katrae]MDK9497049.1 hypothetical protein [Streptomyces katrae]
MKVIQIRVEVPGLKEPLPGQLGQDEGNRHQRQTRASGQSFRFG